MAPEELLARQLEAPLSVACPSRGARTPLLQDTETEQDGGFGWKSLAPCPASQQRQEVSTGG